MAQTVLAVLVSVLAAAVTLWIQPTITEHYHISEDLRGHSAWAMGSADQSLLKHSCKPVPGTVGSLEAGALALFAYHSNKSVVNLLTTCGSIH